MAEQSFTHEQEPTASGAVVEGTGEAAVGTTVEIITEVPGFKGDVFVDPKDVVKKINEDLTSRDPNKPAPQVFPGTRQF